jgi:hypothetical protein
MRETGERCAVGARKLDDQVLGPSRTGKGVALGSMPSVKALCAARLSCKRGEVSQTSPIAETNVLLQG